jgi:chemotaxis protein methyltransferase CheR
MPELAGADLRAASSRWVEATLGLFFPPHQWPELERGLQLAAARLGLPHATACAQQAVAGRLGEAQRRVLAECLTIGETYFFREPLVFEQLARQVLAPLIAARRAGTRHLRLWSAACSTGEEPYSLAMLLATLLPDWRDWNISILATDLNPAALAKGRTGSYGPWSLRGALPPAARAFLPTGADGRFEVDAQLRRLVRFAPLNLAGDAFPSATTGTLAMDLVLCRNVLIYFEPTRALEVLARLGGALAHDGWLVTTPLELPHGPVPGLSTVAGSPLAALRPRAAVQARPAAPAQEPAGQVQAALPVQPPLLQGQMQPPQAAGSPAPSAAGLREQARACADAGALEAAEALCRQALAHDSLDAAATYLLASILLERGALAPAAAALRRTLYLDPQHVPARLALGTLSLQRGQARAGRRQLSRAQAQLAACDAGAVLPGGGGFTAGELEAILLRTRAATP